MHDLQDISKRERQNENKNWQRKLTTSQSSSVMSYNTAVQGQNLNSNKNKCCKLKYTEYLSEGLESQFLVLCTFIKATFDMGFMQKFWRDAKVVFIHQTRQKRRLWQSLLCKKTNILIKQENLASRLLINMLNNHTLPSKPKKIIGYLPGH